MTEPMLIVLFILTGAIALWSWGRPRADIVAVLIVLALLLTRVPSVFRNSIVETAFEGSSFKATLSVIFQQFTAESWIYSSAIGNAGELLGESLSCGFLRGSHAFS